MKSYRSTIFLFSAFCLCLFVANSAFAQAAAGPVTVADPVFQPPQWLESLILLIKSLPKVGPILVELLKWVGVVSTVMTSFSVAVGAVAKSLAGIAKFAGFVKTCEAITYWNDHVQPFLKYLSVFNVQKNDKGA